MLYILTTRCHCRAILFIYVGKREAASTEAVVVVETVVTKPDYSLI